MPTNTEVWVMYAIKQRKSAASQKSATTASNQLNNKQISFSDKLKEDFLSKSNKDVHMHIKMGIK